MQRLQLAEHYQGALRYTLSLEEVAEELRFTDSRSGSWPLKLSLLVAVMERYGGELTDEGKTLEHLQLGEGCRLRRMLYLPRFEVVARDYLVLERSDEPTLCVLSELASRALAHLVSAQRGEDA